MYGVAFYLQIVFLVFILWATTTALYMGVFHSHHETVSGGRKAFTAILSTLIAVVVWGFLYSWTYLSW